MLAHTAAGDGREPQPAAHGLWAAVERLVERAPTVQDVRVHRLEPFAARVRRGNGEAVPAPILEEERFAAVASLVAPVLLTRIRDAHDGAILLMKGPEIAALYEDPALRSFRDVDVLVDDAPAAQRALLAAGFVEVGDPSRYVGIHHLRPLVAPGLPVGVEVHAYPKWVDGLRAPSVESLLDAGVASLTGVAGILGPPPAMHALLLAVHSWAHEPLRRLRDLVDVAAACERAGAGEVRELARAWRLERLWRTTERIVERVLRDEALPPSVRPWARNLGEARERTVLENHLTRWLSGFSALPPRTALAQLALTVGREFRPETDETWREKAGRAVLAVAHARYPRSRHEQTLDRYEV